MSLSSQILVRTCCEHLLAIGALIITRCGEGPWQVGLSHQMSPAMAQKVITPGLALRQPSTTGAYVTTMLVGRTRPSTSLPMPCPKRLRRLTKQKCGWWCCWPAMHDFSSHTTGLVEAFALSLGMAIGHRVEAFAPQKAVPTFVDNCAICDQLQFGIGWMPSGRRSCISQRTSIVLSSHHLSRVPRPPLPKLAGSPLGTSSLPLLATSRVPAHPNCS